MAKCIFTSFAASDSSPESGVIRAKYSKVLIPSLFLLVVSLILVACGSSPAQPGANEATTTNDSPAVTEVAKSGEETADGGIASTEELSEFEEDSSTQTPTPTQTPEPTATVSPTPTQEPTPEPTPIATAVPYEHPPVPENLHTLFNREVDDVNHLYFVGEGMEAGIEFPVFSAIEGFSDFELFSFSEIQVTDKLVEMMGGRYLREAHYRYNFDRRGTGEEVNYQQYLDLVRKGEGHYEFHHFKEISPGNWERTQTTIDPRNGPAMSLELIDDLIYQFDENFGFPKGIGDPSARTRGFVDLSVNELGQPVVTLSFSAESYRQNLDRTSLSAGSLMTTLVEQRMSKAYSYYGAADEYWINNNKQPETSRAAMDYWNRESIKAMWEYYRPEEEVPDLSNLDYNTWPKQAYDSLIDIINQAEQEGHSYLISLKP